MCADELTTYRASDCLGLASQAGIRSLLKQVLKNTHVGLFGVMCHVRDSHEGRPTSPEILLIHLNMPFLHQESHAVQLQHRTLCCQETEAGTQRHVSRAGLCNKPCAQLS